MNIVKDYILDVMEDGFDGDTEDFGEACEHHLIQWKEELRRHLIAFYPAYYNKYSDETWDDVLDSIASFDDYAGQTFEEEMKKRKLSLETRFNPDIAQEIGESILYGFDDKMDELVDEAKNWFDEGYMSPTSDEDLNEEKLYYTPTNRKTFAPTRVTKKDFCYQLNARLQVILEKLNVYECAEVNFILYAQLQRDSAPSFNPFMILVRRLKDEGDEKRYVVSLRNHMSPQESFTFKGRISYTDAQKIVSRVQKSEESFPA